MISHIAVIALLGGLNACGGGGGGGTAATTLPTPAPTPVTTTPTPTPTTPTLGYAVQPQTTEDKNSENSLGPVNAFVPIIHDGVLGQNQTIAVFDTGVYANHPDLVTQVLTTQGYDEGLDQQATITTDNDPNTHGTSVSGVIAGARNGSGIEGIAPSSSILPVEMPTDGKGNFTEIDDTHLAPAINYVMSLGSVHVINNSWNTDVSATKGLSIAQYEQQNGGATLASAYPNTVAAWQNFVNRGNVVTWAAGNESAAEPDAFAGLPQEVPALKPGWAVAVAIDPSGTLASYSNACGSTASYCIAAVGSNIEVASGPAASKSGYSIESGTSFAAPAVSGAIALLMSAAPNITAQQALQILFQTANKTGAYAVTTLYGEGVMDLNQAMQPVGQTTVSSNTVSTASVSSTAVALGGAFGLGLSKSLSNTVMTVQDSFKRGFAIPVGSRFAPVMPSFDLIDRVGIFGLPDERFSDGIDSVSLLEDDNPRATAPGGSHMHIMAEHVLAADLTLKVAFGTDPGRVMPSGHDGAAADVAAGLLEPGSVSNPYLSLIDRSATVATDLGVWGGGRVTVATSFGHPFGQAGVVPSPATYTAHIAATDVEASYPVGESATLRLDGGMMIEDGSMLGSVGSGAAQLGRSETWFAGLGGEVKLMSSLSVVGGIHAGISSESGSAGSIVRSAANVQSFAAGLALVDYNAVTAGDRLEIGAGLPLRAISGEADLALPSVVNLDGSVDTRAVTAGTRADGREVDVQAAWITPIGSATQFTGALLFRKDPDNIRNVAPEGVAAVGVNWTF